MRLTVNIATRSRPELLRTTLEHSLPNMSREDTVMMVSVDEDDQATIDSLKALPTDMRLHISIKPREDTRGEKYDRMLTEHPADVYLMGVDCAPFLSPDWDQDILDAAAMFPDGIGCVYTSMANASFPGILAPTAKLVDMIGYSYSHDYPFWFIDHELDDICRMIGRFVFAEDVAYEHQALRPANTMRMRDVAFWAGYFDAMEYERENKARAIIGSPDFDCPEWYREVLCRQFPVVQARSRFVNHGVRQQAEQLEESRGDKGPATDDPGYMRVKRRAIAKLVNNTTSAAYRW